MIDGLYDDDKIIAIPYDDPNMNHYKDIVDVPNHIIEEIKHFFMVYKNLEHKSTTGFKIDSKIIAEAIIEEALKSYEQNKENLNPYMRRAYLPQVWLPPYDRTNNRIQNKLDQCCPRNGHRWSDVRS